MYNKKYYLFALGLCNQAVGRHAAQLSRGGCTAALDYAFLTLDIKIGATIANNKITLIIINQEAP